MEETRHFSEGSNRERANGAKEYFLRREQTNDVLPGLSALNLRATAPNFGTTTVSLATVQSRFRESS